MCMCVCARARIRQYSEDDTRSVAPQTLYQIEFGNRLRFTPISILIYVILK